MYTESNDYIPNILFFVLGTPPIADKDIGRINAK